MLAFGQQSTALLAFLFVLIIPLHAWYKAEEHYVNGHRYVVKMDQPFFRVEHEPHLPVPEMFKDTSNFGKSMVPEEDVFQPHNWTERERKYLPCLDLICVCPFFNGSIIGDACILPNDKQLKPAIRKEYRMLSDEERKQVENAWNAMYRDGTYHRIGRIHKYGGVHAGPGFYPWHREFQKRVELVFRSYMPVGSELGIPYWDSTREAELPKEKDSIFFSELLLGDTDEKGNVVKGPYANWKTMDGAPTNTRDLGGDPAGELINEARIDVVMDQTRIESLMAASLPLSSCSILANLTLDDRMLEYSHDYVHYYIGGDFFATHSSVNDVIFWFHHSFMDLIWEVWRQKVQTREEREEQYPATDPNCFPPEHFVDSPMREMEPMINQKGLSNNYTDNMYKYDARPHCSKERPDCKSKFLFCDTKNEYARCMSRVKLGGNCTGYEGTDICFEARCVKGLCSDTVPEELNSATSLINAFIPFVLSMFLLLRLC